MAKKKPSDSSSVFGAKNGPKQFIPTAADRTVGMFSGVTKLEEIQSAIDEVEEQTQREKFTGIEGEIERWRNQAFEGQEWTCRTFYNSDNKNHQASCSVSAESQGSGSGTPGGTHHPTKDGKQASFRLSKSKGWMYLESLRSTGRGERSYGYSGVMFPELDFWALVDVFVRSAKESDVEKLKELIRGVLK